MRDRTVDGRMTDKGQLADRVAAAYERHINPSLARLMRFMGLTAVEVSADGSVVRDDQGREYIDCLGSYGVFNLGHRHPRVVAAVREQLDRMPLSSKIMFSKPLAGLAELLASVTPGDLQYSFVVNSGTEAVEGALKLARIATGRTKIVATDNSFHGKTCGALSLTGRALYRDPFQPLLPEVIHVPFDNLPAVAAVIEGAAAVVVEPIQGEGGVIVPGDGYLSGLRQLCDKHRTLLVADEVQTGMGRTGKMWAVEHWGVVPDILCTAKALGGGVMPIGAYIARPHLMDKYFESPLLHTSTFGGNPLACAAAVAAINATRDEGLCRQAEIKGRRLLNGLQQLAGQHPGVIAGVRGKGLMIGVELVSEGVGGMMMAEFINAGVLVAYTLNNPTVIRLEPPLNIDDQLLGRVLEIWREVAAKAETMLEDLT
ncbi:MAG: aminotransferase class III-fold pyridoxal phosphate-dependent enzyme [Negativicutes bacterium]|nr:aminotransferase class III-fold pyridoxal phosphate-dependent enzyme [Negativicutes bacterium]